MHSPAPVRVINRITPLVISYNESPNIARTSQRRYAKEEAKYLLQSHRKSFDLTERLRILGMARAARRSDLYPLSSRDACWKDGRDGITPFSASSRKSS